MMTPVSNTDQHFLFSQLVHLLPFIDVSDTYVVGVLWFPVLTFLSHDHFIRRTRW
jgi:hypothetical protein